MELHLRHRLRARAARADAQGRPGQQPRNETRLNPGVRGRRSLSRGKPHRIQAATGPALRDRDRKSTRLNSSHSQISYAVFCLKKKTFANEFNDSPLRRVNGVSAAHLHPEEGRVELHGRLEVLHANAGIEELGLHGLGTPEVCRWIKSFSVPVLGADYGPCPRVSTGSAAEDDPSIEASNQGEGRSRGAS